MKKKLNGKAKWGIALIIIQVLGVIGNLKDGSIIPEEGVGRPGFILGYFLLGIIGVILLVVGLGKKDNNTTAVNNVNDNNNYNNNYNNNNYNNNNYNNNNYNNNNYNNNNYNNNSNNNQ